jgi:surface-anchored protein
MSLITRLFAFATVFALCSLPVHAEVRYYTEGHADLGLGDEDALELHFHAHGGAIVDGVPVDDAGLELSPSEVVIVVPESTKNYARDVLGGAQGSIPAALGLPQGADYWFLPESNDSTGGGAAALHSPFFGLGAEDVSSGVFDGDIDGIVINPDGIINLSLISKEGPGHVAVGTSSHGWYMSTADGISPDQDKIEAIFVGTHSHLAWYFSQPGTYQLTFQASAAIAGETVTNQNTYTFQVVPEPSVLVLLALAAVPAIVFAVRRHKG